jgi:uncharacterized protein
MPQEKLRRLKELLGELRSAAIAFSGGVDSTLLALVAREVLGPRAILVTTRSDLNPVRELDQARYLARQLGMKHLVVEGNELEVPGFADNPPNRCYLCKKALFRKLREVASREGLEHLAVGSNVDDTGEHRPGLLAAQEEGVRSPLLEAGMTKADIRALAREMGLPNWNRPSYACLASRFPYDTKLTREKIAQVDQAEEYLRQQGFTQVRVRHHGDLARIELMPEEMGRLLAGSLSPKVAGRLKELGFSYVTLDLRGYRSGSMDEVLPGPKALGKATPKPAAPR